MLNTELTDVFGTSVISLVVVVFDLGFLRLVDAADVTNHMAGQFSIRIDTKQAGPNLHPRKAKALGCKARHLGVRQAGTNGQRPKALGFFHELFKPSTVAAGDIQNLGQLVNRALEVKGLGRRDLQRVSRIVASQYHPIAVLNQASVGHDRHNCRAVALSLRAQVIVSHDLQINQTRQHQNKTKHHNHAEHKHTRAKTRQIDFDVA